MDYITDNTLIKDFENSCTINEICGICAEEIETNHDKDILRCKHIYHHECIFTWFESIEKKNKSMSTVAHRQCPYCCTQSDYLLLRDNENPIKHVHKISEKYKKKGKHGLGICIALKNNGKPCKYNAKVSNCNGNFCGIHA